tara:strand:+ start:225 stop:620 length:396 start_codon:yes stop_codon:yes gene_type:complete
MSENVRNLVKRKTRKQKPKADDVIPNAPRGKKRGRPPGQYATQLALQEMMYSHPDKEAVIQELFTAALDQDHKNSAPALKILTDRLVPVSGFEKLRGTNNIQINISTIGEADIKETVIEGEEIATIEEDAD